MSQSCRNAIQRIWADESVSFGSNAGLLRDRYLELSVKDDKHKDARGRLQEMMRKAIAQTSAVYQLAYAKDLAQVQTHIKEGIFKTAGRMVIGLGGENVLETGISLQHTYGTPLIPGSALKGLAAHYCDHAWGVVDPKFKLGGVYHKTIFGTSEDSGHIIFHDSWITPDSLVGSLKLDVMTPHHTEYYSNKDGAAPSDFDDPTPITFLSIEGRFHIVISCDVQNEDGKKWTKLAFKILTKALEEWGIGGKTSSGYGRLFLENSNRRSNSASPNIADTVIATQIPDGHNAKDQPPAAAKIPRHNKGDTIEVTKVPDPKEKRGASYFMADDGIGGLVVLGTPPSIEIGQKTRLEVNGVMEKEGLYNFAAIGAKKEPIHQTRGKRGRI